MISQLMINDSYQWLNIPWLLGNTSISAWLNKIKLKFLIHVEDN